MANTRVLMSALLFALTPIGLCETLTELKAFFGNKDQPKTDKKVEGSQGTSVDSKVYAKTVGNIIHVLAVTKKGADDNKNWFSVGFGTMDDGLVVASDGGEYKLEGKDKKPKKHDWLSQEIKKGEFEDSRYVKFEVKKDEISKILNGSNTVTLKYAGGDKGAELPGKKHTFTGSVNAQFTFTNKDDNDEETDKQSDSSAPPTPAEDEPKAQDEPEAQDESDKEPTFYEQFIETIETYLPEAAVDTIKKVVAHLTD